MSSFHSLTTKERWAEMGKKNPNINTAQQIIYDSLTQEHDSKKLFHKNIEAFVGTIKVPLGIAGPLRVKNSHTDREYYVPIATTEACLVASIGRGCKALNIAGGVRSRVVDQRVQRSPLFEFSNLDSALYFGEWVVSGEMRIKFEEVAATTTKHGKIINIKPFVQGNRVVVTFEFSTGEAMGQNMVSIATQKVSLVSKILNYIRKINPPGMTYSILEAGHSSDKSGTAVVLQHTRGRKVVAECTIPKEEVEKVLKTSVASIVKVRQAISYGQLSVGQVGTLTGNVANVLAAMYIACGQDPACVSEGQVGICRFEETENGDMYCSMTLPGLLVGIIGGGTALPSQSAGISILDCKTSNELAEVIGSVCLAGELSLCAAVASDDFASAHQKFARAKL